MIIGCLAFGMLGAVGAATVALLSGFGFLAGFGFYVLGGSLTTMVVVCISLRRHPTHQLETLAVKV